MEISTGTRLWFLQNHIRIIDRRDQYGQLQSSFYCRRFSTFVRDARKLRMSPLRLYLLITTGTYNLHDLLLFMGNHPNLSLLCEAYSTTDPETLPTCEDLSAIFKNHRTSLQKTLGQISIRRRHLAVSRQQIHRLESGTADPTIDTVIKHCQLYGISMTDFFIKLWCLKTQSQSQPPENKPAS